MKGSSAFRMNSIAMLAIYRVTITGIIIAIPVISESYIRVYSDCPVCLARLVTRVEDSGSSGDDMGQNTQSPVNVYCLRSTSSPYSARLSGDAVSAVNPPDRDEW